VQYFYMPGAKRSGMFYCRKRRNTCSFCVKFNCSPEKGGLKLHHIVLEHQGHQPRPKETEIFGNKELVNSKKQMTEDVWELCSFRLSMPVIKEKLVETFPNRHFDTKLLDNLVYTARKEHLGNDPDRINELIANGHKNQREGDVFEFNLDPETMLLRQVFIQTPLMKKYAEIYKDFKILDGTFNTNRYGLTKAVPTLVDCLGKSVLAADNTFPTESKEDAIQTLRLAGLDQPNSVLMTDEALGFVSAAEELKLNHVLCRWHYMDGIPTAIRSVFQGS
jgi:hypothetical protein